MTWSHTFARGSSEWRAYAHVYASICTAISTITVFMHVCECRHVHVLHMRPPSYIVCECAYIFSRVLAPVHDADVRFNRRNCRANSAGGLDRIERDRCELARNAQLVPPALQVHAQVHHLCQG